MKYSHWPSWILKLTSQPLVDSQKLSWHDNHVLLLFEFPGSSVSPVCESSQCWLQMAQSPLETESGLGAVCWNIIGKVLFVNLTIGLKLKYFVIVHRVVTVFWNSGQLSKRYECVDKFEVILCWVIFWTIKGCVQLCVCLWVTSFHHYNEPASEVPLI